MLCDACNSIDLTKASYKRRTKRFLHHKSYADIRQSAASGCELCQMIVADMSRTGTHAQIDWDEEEKSMEIPQVAYFVSNYQNPMGRSGGPWSSLHFMHAHAPEKIKNLVSGRPVEARADSEFCYSLAHKWMNQCLQEHSESCVPMIDQIMPTRVIDIGTKDGFQSPYLYLTNGGQGSWVSLSHVWGRKSRFVTDSSNISKRLKSIPVEDMPSTFRDAVELTRRLGQRYLWIDSLCILQDSREDWAEESVKMGYYYKHSTLTIAVDSANGDDQGFLATPRHSDMAYKPVEIHIPGEELHQVYVELRPNMYSVTAWDTHLGRRAWALQEDLLSPRTLHYTSSQIVWQYQFQVYCENDVNPHGHGRDSNTFS